jgi:hypothetical protein
MLISRATALVLLLLACSWPAPSTAIGNLGGYRTLGLTYCSEYAQAHAAALGANGTLDRDSGPFAAHAGFVLGYFSAFNAWVVNDIVDITDNAPFEQLFASLADHCREHPDETLAHAIEALVHRPRRVTSIKATTGRPCDHARAVSSRMCGLTRG